MHRWRLDCWIYGLDVEFNFRCYFGMFDLDANGKICGWRDYFDMTVWFKNGGPTLHI